MDDAKRQLLLLVVIGAVTFGLYESGILGGDGENEETPAAEVAEAAPADTGGAYDPLSAPPLDAGVREAREAAETLYTIETDAMRAVFTDRNTGVVSVQLKEEQFANDDGSLLELVTTDKERYFPFRVYVTGVEIPEDAVWTGRQVDATHVEFEYRTEDGIRIVREIRAAEQNYELVSRVRVINESAHQRHARVRYMTHHYLRREDESGGFIARPPTRLAKGACYHSDEESMDRAEVADLVTDTVGFPSPEFTGFHDTYFSNLLISTEGEATRCVLSAQRRGAGEEGYSGTLLQAELRFPQATLDAGQETVATATAFMGPHDRDVLRASGHHLSEVIDLGWFSIIADGLISALKFIRGFVGNWGFAIILLTFFVKLLFLPLTMKSFESMAAMRRLKPQIDALNEKYGDDREAKGAATMALYKREGVNPAAGCLPSLLQMPVWFALYRSLSTNVELYRAPFALWWQDLSAPDPYFVLPVIVGLLMHFQQRLTPNTMDPAQAKIFMYVMPIIFGGFMLFLPAGLCLYIVTNSTLSILQQRWIYRRLDEKEAAKKAAGPQDEADDDADVDDDSDAQTDNSDTENPGSGSASRRPTSGKKKKRKARSGRR